MTKILTRACSIPDLGGSYEDSKVELNVIHAVQFDIETYNYIDVVLRKLKMGILASEVKAGEQGGGKKDDEKKEEEGDGDDDDDETKKVPGINAIIIGPDGVPLKRNNSDVMNNFFINFTVRAFTEIEKVLLSIN
mgnify:CR=1 FL=1|jgi:hypothetical protein